MDLGSDLVPALLAAIQAAVRPFKRHARTLRWVARGAAVVVVARRIVPKVRGIRLAP